jgi:hypothetical protein
LDPGQYIITVQKPLKSGWTRQQQLQAYKAACPQLHAA